MSLKFKKKVNEYVKQSFTFSTFFLNLTSFVLYTLLFFFFFPSPSDV